MDAKEHFRIEIERIIKWLDDSEQDAAVQNWKLLYQDILLCLLLEDIPFCQYHYVPDRFKKKYNRAYIQLSDLIYQPGIILKQIRYIDHTDNDSIKTTWLTKKEWKNKPGKRSLILECQWTLRPLYISARTHSLEPKRLRYHYKMIAKMYDKRTNRRWDYAADITTGWEGRLLEQRIFMGDKTDPFPHRFGLPTRIVSIINRCLYNNFFPQLWEGPLCAAWHRSDEGVARYMGSDRDAQKDLAEPLEKLINSSCGYAVSILLSYACFSMLKSFFPSFHILHNDSPYPEAKKYIPQQIALNIQSEELNWAEKLTNMFCGHFQRLESGGMSVIDGILVQKFPTQLKKLSVNEFESKVLQPASVLWVNRVPDKALVERGEILNIQVPTLPEDAIDEQCGSYLVNSLARCIFTKTFEAREKCLLENWDKSIPHIKCFISNVTQIGERQRDYYFADDLEIRNIQNQLNHIKPIDPEFYLMSLKNAIIADIDAVQNVTKPSYIQLEALKERILACYKKCRREIRKTQKESKLTYYSLNNNFEKTLNDLKLKLPRNMLRSIIVEKIAYLSTSFQFFAKVVVSSNSRCKDLCESVEASLISAYQSQLEICQPKEIIEEYILNLLQTGQCARIRGENSDSSNTLVWYDLKTEEYLVPANDYFDSLKKFLPKLDVNRMDFEVMLAGADILRTVQRKKQQRRTFEVVVQKGKGKRAVL